MGRSTQYFSTSTLSVRPGLLRPANVPVLSKYYPPMDRNEQHYPGMNFCGPGTNVWKRMKMGVNPTDELDSLCFQHDLDTEPRGPYKSRGKRELLRASDKRLIRSCRTLLKKYPNDGRIHSVISIMQLVLDHGARGR